MMASYAELRNLFSDDTLRNRVTVACVIAAKNQLNGTPTAAQEKFAETVFSNPDEMGRRVLMAVLAANNGLTVAQINAATDAAIQTAVDSVIPNMVSALFG